MRIGRILGLSTVLALSALAGRLPAAPMFYLSDEPLGVAHAGDILNFAAPGSSGQLNLYATTDVQLSGVSMDVLENGDGLKFTSANVLNDGRWAFLDGPLTVQDSHIDSIGGGAIPGVVGNGIGGADAPDAHFDPTSGYLLATIGYDRISQSIPDLSLRVGRNLVADWYGNMPTVYGGDGAALANVERPIIPPAPAPSPAAGENGNSGSPTVPVPPAAPPANTESGNGDTAPENTIDPAPTPVVPAIQFVVPTQVDFTQQIGFSGNLMPFYEASGDNLVQIRIARQIELLGKSIGLGELVVYNFSEPTFYSVLVPPTTADMGAMSATSGRLAASSAPEPATITLFGLCAAPLACFVRRRRR
jgi:hypothetical protein